MALYAYNLVGCPRCPHWNFHVSCLRVIPAKPRWRSWPSRVLTKPRSASMSDRAVMLPGLWLRASHQSFQDKNRSLMRVKASKLRLGDGAVVEP